MSILNTYDCDQELLSNIFERLVIVGDRVDLPDGVYANMDDQLGAVVVNGRYVAELQLYNEHGECWG